jgi:hypothetical protein
MPTATTFRYLNLLRLLSEILHLGHVFPSHFSPIVNDMIHKTKHGRAVTIDPKVLVWRKRKRQFAAYKQKLLKLFLSKNLTKSQVEFYLNLPYPELWDKTPRALMVPKHIVRVYRVLKRKLTSIER